MITYYGSKISPNKTETVEGFLICRNVPIARTGKQTYLARELQLDGAGDRMVDVNRYEADVFEPAVLASFEGKPVTDGHPAENVGPENFSNYAKGHVQNVRREGDFIIADLYINDAVLISEVQNGVKKEVSCGYMCNYEEDGAGYKQTHIRGNHVAVVPAGRAGHSVAIKDAAVNAAQKGNPMSKFLTDVLTAFGMAAKDAKPEDLKEMVDATAGALEKVDKAQEAEPAEPEKEEAQDADPAEKAEEAKAEEPAEEPAQEPAEEPAKDEEPAAEEPAEDEKPAELSLDAKLDKVLDLLNNLKAGKACDAETQESEEAVTIPADEIESAEPEKAEEPASDSAAEVMKRMRPVLAGIADADQRKKVTDALLASLNVKGGKMGDIMNASAEHAAADAAVKTSYEKMCEAQANAYSARNPHKKEA